MLDGNTFEILCSILYNLQMKNVLFLLYNILQDILRANAFTLIIPNQSPSYIEFLYSNNTWASHKNGI